MADVAIARREARRRKILENSHNRLQLISGKNDNDAYKESPINSPRSIESTENSIQKENSSTSNCILNNGVVNAAEEQLSFMSTNHESFGTGDGDELSYDLETLITPNSTGLISEPTQVTEPIWERISNNNYDIVLGSILIQLLYCFSLVTFEGTYFFLPVVLYIVTKNFLFPKQRNSSIANLLLLLNGMSSSRVQKIISVTQYISTFTQDVCVFLFTTICTQSLCQTIRNSIE